jgi:YD repeat-containing protein
MSCKLTWFFSLCPVRAQGAKRSNWGFGYWDATYSESDSGSSEFSGSKILWNWPGWKLAEVGGRTYYFPASDYGRSAAQSGLLAIEDRQGNRLNLPRDEVGNLIRAHVTGGGRRGGPELDFQYDKQNRITQVWDRSGPFIDYSYDPGGRLVRVKELDGQATDYSYDAKNRMTTVMQNGSSILTNEYDAGDRVTGQTLPDGRAYTFKYSLDRAGQVVAVDVRDSAGLTWKINMSGGSQYTMKPIRNQ